LHFRSSSDDNGFSQEQRTMHVVEGKGDLMGLVRDELPERGNAWKMAKMAGPGESSYTAYDRDITNRAMAWLKSRGGLQSGKPWVLFVSFVAPHFPLTAPEHWYRRYYEAPALPMPKLYAAAERPRHPYLVEYGDAFAYDKYFNDEASVRRAIAGYYGLCSFLDENVGKVLSTLHETGLAANTRIIYTSDHGDNLGARGLWGKSNMYEESVAVPLVMAGMDVPAGHVSPTPVSLVDIYPTVLDAIGSTPHSDGHDMPGESLIGLVRAHMPDRVVFSEYHGMGSTGGVFMVRKGRHKYVHRRLLSSTGATKPSRSDTGQRRLAVGQRSDPPSGSLACLSASRSTRQTPQPEPQFRVSSQPGKPW
jgi:choline-sulfatase